MFFEGQRVSYLGDPGNGLDIGDEGLVVAAGNTASHVKWLSGARTGTFDEVPHHRLTATASGVPDIDALHGRLVNLPIKSIASSHGPMGLLRALNEAGHLGNFDSVAEEALRYVSSLVRQDPSISEVLGQLEFDDAEEFVALASITLLKDAFGRDEE